MSNKKYGTFVNLSSKTQTIYSLKSDSDALNAMIKEHEVPLNDEITFLDYTAKVFQENYVQLSFMQYQDEDLKNEVTLLFNIEKDKLARTEDFFTPQAIRYLTYEQQQSTPISDDYNAFIQATDVANHSVIFIDENQIKIGPITYDLITSQRYTNPDEVFPPVAINVPVTKKLIAFTFDDGPHNRNTQRAMSILESYNGQGTFFIMGPRAASFPDIVKETLNRNHQIASHTYNHKNLTNLSEENVRYEILETERIINEIIQSDKHLMVRPPYGALNNNVKTLVPRNYINWSIDSDDWANVSGEEICNTIVSTAHENGIILMHDLYDRTIEGLDCAAKKLNEQGYQFVSVDTLYKANNIVLEEGKLYFSARK